MPRNRMYHWPRRHLSHRFPPHQHLDLANWILIWTSQPLILGLCRGIFWAMWTGQLVSFTFCPAYSNFCETLLSFAAVRTRRIAGSASSYILTIHTLLEPRSWPSNIHWCSGLHWADGGLLNQYFLCRIPSLDIAADSFWACNIFHNNTSFMRTCTSQTKCTVAAAKPLTIRIYHQWNTTLAEKLLTGQLCGKVVVLQRCFHCRNESQGSFEKKSCCSSAAANSIIIHRAPWACRIYVLKFCGWTFSTCMAQAIWILYQW